MSTLSLDSEKRSKVNLRIYNRLVKPVYVMYGTQIMNEETDELSYIKVPVRFDNKDQFVSVISGMGWIVELLMMNYVRHKYEEEWCSCNETEAVDIVYYNPKEFIDAGKEMNRFLN